MTRHGSDQIPPASILGRIGKLLVGLVQVYYSIVCIQHFRSLTTPSLSSGWLFVAAALWLFPYNVNLGFARIRKLGHRPLWAVVIVVAAAGVWDWWTVGSAWGPLVARVLMTLTIYTHLHMGLSHLLAAVIGLRGCEMRVVPYLIAKLRDGNEIAQLCLCPGLWTPIDRWEARLRGRDGWEGQA